jgi:hypothetical protein
MVSSLDIRFDAADVAVARREGLHDRQNINHMLCGIRRVVVMAGLVGALPTATRQAAAAGR